MVRAVLSLFLLVTKRLYGKEREWSIGQIKTCRKKQHVKIDGKKEMSELICGKAAVGGNYNSTRDNEVKLVFESTTSYKLSDRRKIIEQNKKNVVRHAYYHEYNALQQLCILILQNEKHQMGAGSKKVFGILFDGAWLWEEYVNTLIKDTFYHPMNKGGKGAQWLFAGGTGLIYPDFMSRSTDNRIIADAKYKPITNIGNKDYLQILAYMFRFDSRKAFYLYPETNNSDDIELVMNKGTSFEDNVSARNDISVIKHGLKIPYNVRKYSDFLDEIKVSEQEFVKLMI